MVTASVQPAKVTSPGQVIGGKQGQVGIPRGLEGDLWRLASIWGPPKTIKGGWFLTLAQGRAPCATLILGQISQNWHSYKAGPADNWDRPGLWVRLGWKGKERSICSPEKQWGNEMEIGTSEYLYLSPRGALGCREQFPKSSSVTTQLYPLRNLFLLLDVQLLLISFSSARAGDKRQTLW